MGIDRPGGTDTRAENVENPPAEDSPPAPPPDRPGSPGQPSRLESRRAAREAQEARRAETGTQQAAPQETGTEQREERQKDRGESSSAEPADKEQDAQADPKTPERAPGSETESDAETGLERPDGRGEQPSTVETGELAPEQGTEPRGEVQDDKAEPSSNGLADERPDAPAEPQTSEERPMTGETEPGTGETGQPDGSSDEPPHQDTGEVGPGSPEDRDRPDDREAETETPQDRDHQPLPQQDGQAPRDDGNEARGEASNEQKAQAEDETAGHDRTSQDEPAPAEQKDGRTDTPRPTEDPVRTSDNLEPGDAPEVRVAWPSEPDEGVTRWASPVIQFNDRTPGTQIENRGRNGLEQSETPTTTDDEPNKYRNLPELSRDGTPGRGELNPPEDDPEERDHLEPDPDTTRRRDRLGRRTARQANDMSDIGTKMGNGLGKFLGDRPPGPLTTSTGRDVPNVHSPYQPMKLGSGGIGIAVGSILIYKAGQLAVVAGRKKVSEVTGRRYGDNQ